MRRVAFALAALWLPLVTAAADWRMDAQDSRLMFTATYERAPAPGVFRRFDVRLRFDPQKPTGGRLHVTVDITSADMDSADVNEAIRQSEWFDTARFPQAEFESHDIRRRGPGEYRAHGRLRLKGVEREVVVPFTWREAGITAVMEGALTLDRTAFSIGSGEWASGETIGLDVQVRFKVTLRQVGREKGARSQGRDNADLFSPRT